VIVGQRVRHIISNHTGRIEYLNICGHGCCVLVLLDDEVLSRPIPLEDLDAIREKICPMESVT
jgi:hypothetical protein